MRLEGVDAASGIHYVRLILYLPSGGGSIDAPPRFIMECTENKGKRDLAWFVSFGGVSNIYFTPPFSAHATATISSPQSQHEPQDDVRGIYEVEAIHQVVGNTAFRRAALSQSGRR